MVMLNTAVGFNEKYENAKRNLESLRKEYSALVLQYAELIHVARPAMESEYMMKIGRKEYKLFALQVEILRCKRKISLYQSAINQSRNISLEEIEEIIWREFAAYQKQLKEQQKKIKTAEEHFAAQKLSPEETKTIKKLYRDLVRKLHPDLNPDLPPQAAALWNKIVDAYKNSDWEELTFLADMTKEFFKGRKDIPDFPGTLEAILKQKNTLQKKRDALIAAIKEIQAHPPFSYRELLADPGQILEKRKELNNKILQQKNRLSEIRKILDGLKGLFIR